MLLKISDSWGSGVGYLALTVVVLALIGVATVLTAVVWGLVRLFRRKERKKAAQEKS